MRMASPRLVSQLQRLTVSGFYGDSAFLLVDVPDGTYDDYNNPVIVTSQIPIPGSFTDKPKVEAWQGIADVEMVEAEYRFKGPRPTKGNRIKVVGRFDDLNYVDKTFEIIGIQDRGAFGFVCALKATTV